MTNVESMDYTHSHPSTIASLSSTAQLSLVPDTHRHGISIAIPRHIAMQLSTILFIMTRFMIVILLYMIM